MHVHACPGVEQVEPATVQSVLVQQLLVEMHEVVAVHSRSPPGQAHVPPGMGQISPEIVQSPLLQQLLAPMHVPLAMHIFSPAPHTQLPLLHVCIGPHALPQAPQLFESLFVFAQYGCAGPPASTGPPPASVAIASDAAASPPPPSCVVPVSIVGVPLSIKPQRVSPAPHE
jgi:hypothetical protein